ncbi:MAG: hypothetical protein HKN26_15510 [Acidimicrobiales bacterium]|nr:hypothetical protein [Acidimicrobiales bacterium]
MNRGAGKRPIFLTDDDRRSFLALVGEAVERFAVEIHAYCLMGNHFHLLVHTPHANLDRVMRHIAGVHAQRFNRRHETDGPVFRGRYKALVVDSDAYLLEASRYIHRNPVAHDSSIDLRAYPWSSFPAYAGDVGVPPWLTTVDILRQFGPRGARAYGRFVAQEMPNQPVPDFDQAVFGGDGFRAAALGHASITNETKPMRERTARLITLDEIDAAVGDALDIDPRLICTPSFGQRRVDRLLAVALGQKLGQQTLSALASRYSYASHSGVASALQTWRCLLSERPDLRKLQSRLEEFLGHARAPQSPAQT